MSTKRPYNIDEYKKNEIKGRKFFDRYDFLCFVPYRNAYCSYVAMVNVEMRGLWTTNFLGIAPKQDLVMLIRV